MSVVYSKVIGDSCFGKSAIDEAIEKLESIPVSYLFILICRPYTSRVMRKPTFCICENKDADVKDVTLSQISNEHVLLMDILHLPNGCRCTI